ncbi:MAG: hypothetical protein ACPF8V_08190, partial [Luteibaculum sp.]
KITFTLSYEYISNMLRVLLCVTLIGIGLTKQNISFGQVSNSPQNKLALGGEFSLAFGSITLINISPKLGYRFSEKFMAGPGVVYQYYRDRINEPDFKFSTNVFGPAVFARYRVTPGVAAYTEFQQLFYRVNSNINEFNESVQVPVLFVGAQVFQQIGSNVSLNFSLLIDVLEYDESPYPNPYIGAGGFYFF